MAVELSHCDLHTGLVCIRHSPRHHAPRASFACGAMLSPTKLSMGDPKILTTHLLLRIKIEWRLLQEAWVRHPPLEVGGPLVGKMLVLVRRNAEGCWLVCLLVHSWI